MSHISVSKTAGVTKCQKKFVKENFDGYVVYQEGISIRNGRNKNIGSWALEGFSQKKFRQLHYI